MGLRRERSVTGTGWVLRAVYARMPKGFPPGLCLDYCLSCNGKSAKDPAVAKFPWDEVGASLSFGRKTFAFQVLRFRGLGLVGMWARLRG